jgi:hypothetical protein
VKAAIAKINQISNTPEGKQLQGDLKELGDMIEKLEWISDVPQKPIH